ncbi:TIGR04076 family protein [Pseudonocardia sp. C8]|uniref:TIGR04076 family protein n=1 Tax=Pseudonocardia sp. C8 TaxID=2762759 RepID=UPI001642F61A|nr:TIGR04076 family protein [Pseudonocardia sp. C8]MBC3191932.1 TIGR04076 family protein [Pseudonocardia sp. C8]
MSRHAGVRVRVVRAGRTRCGLAEGDYFDAVGSTLRIPSGRPFCLQAMMAAVPLLMSRTEPHAEDHWLERKPFVCCPDPRERVLLSLDRIDPDTEPS